MSNNKSRLGRGLGGLIAGAGTTGNKNLNSEASKKAAVKKVAKKVNGQAQKPSAQTETSAGNGYQLITVSQVVPNPYQPRREISDEQVEDLARSIQAEGLLQPIVVRKKGKGYELIAGERRLRAFKFLKTAAIPARIMDVSDASSATLALIENVQRENLNPIDEAHAYSSLIRDFDLTQEATAERVGKSRAAIANALRLLALSGEIQGFLSRRLLSTGHAKVLLGVEDPAHRSLLARRVIETGMSVREAEQEVRRLKKNTGGSGSGTGTSGGSESAAEATAIHDLEKRIGKHLSAQVSIKHGAKKGKLTIEYLGNDDLDRILEKLGLNP